MRAFARGISAASARKDERGIGCEAGSRIGSTRRGGAVHRGEKYFVERKATGAAERRDYAGIRSMAAKGHPYAPPSSPCRLPKEPHTTQIGRYYAKRIASSLSLAVYRIGVYFNCDIAGQGSYKAKQSLVYPGPLRQFYKKTHTDFAAASWGLTETYWRKLSKGHFDILNKFRCGR